MPKRLLLIRDQPGSSLESLLTQLEFEVVTVKTSAEAARRARQESFDFVLVDDRSRHVEAEEAMRGVEPPPRILDSPGSEAHEFLWVASHELRTPLTTIKAYNQLLAQFGGDLAPADRSKYLQASLGEIDRMMRLISELLDLSRIESNRLVLHRQPLEWVGFLDGLAGAFRVQHPLRTIGLHSAAEAISLEADSDRMRQVLDNLISNAIKYSAPASAIEISVRTVDARVETTVSDHGIGIPSDELPFIFEQFHRARNVSNRRFGGLGLGLYIARAIVEAHEGSLKVTSEEGQGSSFTISLPGPAV